jgi:hypothetical protein
MARDSSPIGPLDVIALATLAVPGLGEVGVVGEIASEARAARGIGSIVTPFGEAVQSTSEAAFAARAQVSNGATLWRIGTTGKSAAGEAQFWALENPLSPGFASRYGIPPSNVVNANFIESAMLGPGSPFVTRVAPGVGTNIGGGIEVVVPEGGGILQYFGLQ